MHRHQKRPAVITWKQFANKGYSAFASLHRQVRIGVLSVATLSVAAAAQAQRQSSPVVSYEEENIVEEEELAEVTVSGTMAPLTQLQSARIVSVLSRQEIEQAAVQSINDLFKLVTGVDVRQRGGFGIQTDISIDGGTFDQVTLLLVWKEPRTCCQGRFLRHRRRRGPFFSRDRQGFEPHQRWWRQKRWRHPQQFLAKGATLLSRRL